MPQITWIPSTVTGRLGMMPKPLGGSMLSKEIESLQMEGVDLLVTLLEQHEVLDSDLTAEQHVCKDKKIQFFSLPFPDYGIPPLKSAFAKLLNRLGDIMKTGGSVVIHCRAGSGRSSLVVAGILVQQGLSVDEAFDLISRFRHLKVPETGGQRTWLEYFFVGARKD